MNKSSFITPESERRLDDPASGESLRADLEELANKHRLEILKGRLTELATDPNIILLWGKHRAQKVLEAAESPSDSTATHQLSALKYYLNQIEAVAL